MSVGISYGVMETGVLVLLESCNFDKPVDWPKRGSVYNE